MIYYRRASDDSILAIQIFDQKKFKKKDQGFLGVINVRVGSVIDLDIGGDGVSRFVVKGMGQSIDSVSCRNAHQGP